jgi:NADH:ubiquinone oxidoreductase subunit 3 (subunit A)
MTAVLLFVGVVIGVAITIICGLVVIHWLVAEREREPVRFSAIGSGRSMTTGPASTFDFLQRRLK